MRSYAKPALKAAKNLLPVAFSLWTVTVKGEALNISERSYYIPYKKFFLMRLYRYVTITKKQADPCFILANDNQISFVSGDIPDCRRKVKLNQKVNCVFEFEKAQAIPAWAMEWYLPFLHPTIYSCHTSLDSCSIFLTSLVLRIEPMVLSIRLALSYVIISRNVIECPIFIDTGPLQSSHRPHWPLNLAFL